MKIFLFWLKLQLHLQSAPLNSYFQLNITALHHEDEFLSRDKWDNMQREARLNLSWVLAATYSVKGQVWDGSGL